MAETDDQLLLTFELPGMEKDDIKVTVAEGLLTISGERKFSEGKEANGLVRSEIRSGAFSRSFTPPILPVRRPLGLASIPRLQR